MNSTCFLIILFLALVSPPALANKPFGAGVMLGDPTGLSFKYILNNKNFIDAGLAWSGSIDIHLHGDYLWKKPKVFVLDQKAVDLFYGVGARLRERDRKRFSDDDDDGWQIGVRGPVGLSLFFNNPKIEIFAEIALVMNLVPDTDADLDAAIGGRFYF